MKTWIRLRSPVLWGLAVILGVPALANAQQSGLFPLAPIRRERVPCPMEDPVYRLYRQTYFGYHPTCWRRFPPGWGCPSPEAPNVAEGLKNPPLGSGPAPQPPADAGEPAADDLPADDMGPLPGPGARPPRRTPAPGGNLPALPPDNRSPFELDSEPKPAPGPRAGTTTPEVPAAEKPKPEATIETPAGSSPSASTSIGTPAGSSPPASTSELSMPSLPALDEPLGPTTEQPTAPATSSGSAALNELPAPVEAPSVVENSRPALELPDPTAGPDLTGSLAPQPQPLTNSNATTIAAQPVATANGPSAFNNPSDTLTMPPPAPVQAPQRPNFIGRIFNRFRR